MGKKKAGKTEESKKEDDQRPGSTRSGVNYQPRTREPSAEKEPSAERGAAICDQRPGGTMPGPTDSDGPGATQRPTQAGAHSSSSLEAETALVGSDHAPSHNGAASGELQSAERDAEPDRFYHWGPDADSERRAYK